MSFQGSIPLPKIFRPFDDRLPNFRFPPAGRLQFADDTFPVQGGSKHDDVRSRIAGIADIFHEPIP